MGVILLCFLLCDRSTQDYTNVHFCVICLQLVCGSAALALEVMPMGPAAAPAALFILKLACTMR
eukprot:2233264-Pyramimonas_sp.AAC.1